MKILFITNIPTPYTIDFLRQFDNLVDLHVIFEKNSSKDRDKSWKQLDLSMLNVRVLKGLAYKEDMSIAPQVIFRLSKKYDYFIISNPLTPTGLISIFWLKLIGRKYMIISEGGFIKPNRSIKESLKKRVVSGAQICFSGSPLANSFYKYYGAEDSNIKSYPFTSLHRKDILSKIPTRAEKEIVKAELNIGYSRVILSVGRIVHQKGFDLLIQAATSFQDTGFYFIGGRPNKDFLEMIKNLEIKNVTFVDFVSKESLKRYYYISDLFILATRKDEYGLVINEAMSQGLPIISTNMCGAALELVVNNVNVFIIQSNSTVELKDKIATILSDPILMRKMSENSLSKIKFYTFENMANTIFNCLLECRRGKK